VNRIFLITGRPGIGKTTALMRTVNKLKNKGYNVGGMLSREVRENGRRVDFEIIDLSTGNRGRLAHLNQPNGPQVSKYKVNLDDLDQIGVKAIRDALKGAEVVIIDEIGPMEMFSSAFKEAVKDVIHSQKLVLGVIHHSARDRIIDSNKGRNDIEIVEVTLENRQRLPRLLFQETIQFLKEKRNQMTGIETGAG